MTGNLIEEYPADFMATWEGCGHLDCLPKCKLGDNNHYHCERLAVALSEYYRA